MSKNIFLHSSSLFSNPSFTKGMARVWDLLAQLDQYNYKKTGEEADLESLKRDWGIVGLDVFKGVRAYGESPPVSS